MGKLYNNLQEQLKHEEFRNDAEDCIKIMNKLKEINNGSVWDSQWRVLTTISGWIGTFPNKKIAYKPSKIGYIFLKGIENTYTK